ncbi:cell envelope integrity protein TolA [Psychrobacter sp.]|uniref:cell envelope integrity protein TolA n=1 Tax=Psychrobacter sp. TaxID=56811 RepID=UPI003BB03B51
MSSYSFSHQFYQRWTCAPESIRASIIQELTDITTLLQADTPFETFVFSTHDLDAHLDDLYENHEAEQAIAKAIADKQAEAHNAAEKQRLEEEKQATADAKLKEETKSKEAAKILEESEAAQKEQEKNAQLIADENNLNKAVDTIDVKDIDKESADRSIANSNVSNTNKNIATKGMDIDKNATAEIVAGNNRSANGTENEPVQQQSNAAIAATDSNIKTGIDKAVSDAAIHLSLKNTKLGATHPELIRELEMHVDDYLSEQMMQMSENLKSWLRAEVTQHLTEQDKSATNDSLQKK